MVTVPRINPFAVRIRWIRPAFTALALVLGLGVFGGAGDVPAAAGHRSAVDITGATAEPDGPHSVRQPLTAGPSTSWAEIGGPGATFAVSDTQLYGLSPDLTTTYRWNGTAATEADWTRIGGAADAAQQHQDEKLLAANCEPGRDCVKEYRDAKKLLETSLTDWLKDNGGQPLLDTFGVTAVLDCVNENDLSSCLEAAVDAGTTLLGLGALKKTYKLGEAVHRVSKELPTFQKKAKQAQDKYKQLREAIDTARNAQERLPGDADESCETSNSFLHDTLRAAAGTTVAAAPGAGTLRIGSGTWLQSSVADPPDLGCGPYIWVPFRPGVDDSEQGDIPADMGEKSGAFLRPGEYIFIVRLDGSLRAVHVEDMRMVNKDAGHTSLAERQPVIMAGEFEVGPGGVFTWIKNFSGHYMPLDKERFTPLKEITRAAFLAHGWVFPDTAWELPRAQEALSGHPIAGDGSEPSPADPYDRTPPRTGVGRS